MAKQAPSVLGRGKALADRPASDGAQAIRRAVEVLRAVAQIQRSGANLSRVALATGLSTSTAFRILRSLSEERLLRYDPGSRAYSVGPLAYELGLAASSDEQVQARWHAAINEIARTTNLTTYLMARSDKDAVCLLCAQGSTALRAVPMDVGQRLPLGVGAGSLAILSSLPDEEIAAILAAERSRLELFPGGKARPEKILERVALTRRQGFAFSDGIVATGALGVGVAIPPHDGLTQLAISASAVAGTVTLPHLKKIASLIGAVIARGQKSGFSSTAV